MRHKHLSLFLGEFIERRVQLFEEDAARVQCLWAGIGRGQEFLPAHLCQIVLCRPHAFRKGHRPFLPKPVDNPVPHHAKQPSPGLLDRTHHPIGFDQLVESILQNIFNFLIIVDAYPYEVSEPRLLPLDRFLNPPVLLVSTVLGQPYLHLPERRISPQDIVCAESGSNSVNIRPAHSSSGTNPRCSTVTTWSARITR